MANAIVLPPLVQVFMVSVGVPAPLMGAAAVPSLP